ncbi:hypothetical protein GCM10010174_03210 [Kutzneria viridogrisea]
MCCGSSERPVPSQRTGMSKTASVNSFVVNYPNGRSQPFALEWQAAAAAAISGGTYEQSSNQMARPSELAVGQANQ